MADYRMAPPRAFSDRATQTTRQARREDDLGFFQGLGLAVPIALSIWALIIGSITALIP